MLLLGESEIRALVGMEEAVAAVEESFRALARGGAVLPPPIGMDLPAAAGEVHVKGAYLAGAPEFVFKVASGFYRNPERGLPSGSGLMLAFDASTGRPAALLLDNAYLTDLRTGAAGGVAVRHLAVDPVDRVAVVGAGVQARMQVRALTAVRTPRAIALWSRTPERAQRCAAELEREHGVAVAVAPSVEDAVGDADVVITVTPSREPLVRAAWLAPRALVLAVGSDGPDKRELAVDVLAAADLVVADRLDQCLRLGEIHHAVSAGALEPGALVELGAVVSGTAPGRTPDTGLVVADLTGVGVQDAAIAGLALRRAREAGAGTDWSPRS